jgi:hypothetical protein
MLNWQIRLTKLHVSIKNIQIHSSSVTTFGTLYVGNLMQTKNILHLHNPRYFPSYLTIELP